jgi:hypothetical protein
MKFRTNNRLIFVLIIFLSTTLLAVGQTGSISGTVVDRETGTGIPFATVVLFTPEGTTPKDGTTANVDGKFNLERIHDGDYHIQVSFIGYETKNLPNLTLSRTNRHLSLDTIRLSHSAKVLESMVVTADAYTSSSGLDRRTYRVADFETALGGNATDVLNRLPSVSVSADGEVSIQGTSDILIYLNGRPTQLEPSVLLAQIAAGTIESIDIISVPTARYDAQGQGGIININTKTTARQGWSLSLNTTGGGAPWNNETEAYTGYNMSDNRFGGGVNLFFSRKRLRLFSAINYLSRDVNATRNGDARIRYPGTEIYRHMEASGPKPEYYENVSASIGAEYDITPRSSITGSYYYGTRKEWRQAFYLYHVFDGDADKQPVAGTPADHLYLFNPNTGIRNGTFQTVNLDYKLGINDSSTLHFSLLYEYSLLSHKIDNPEIII